jgi:hypothetical protein
MVAVCANDAAAQAPTLSATQDGGRVQMQWTSVGGATAYDIFVTGALNGQVSVPASTTSFVVDPPPGTYNIAVRGTAGAVQGPLSNIVTVTVGGGGGGGAATPPAGCSTIAAPTATVTTSGTSATINWTDVAGAAGYRVQVGQTPGSTQVQQDVPASQTSFVGSAPFFGTFYARVIAGNACGALASSPDVAFTLTPPPPGSTPRTPDPPAGQILPIPAYGAAVVQAMAVQRRGELLNSCANHNWVFLVLQELRRRDSRWGLNWKRGHVGSMSDDILTYNPTNRPDDDNNEIYLIDVIFGHCGSNPDANFQDVTGFTPRNHPDCAAAGCARWTLAPYRATGLQP